MTDFVEAEAAAEIEKESDLAYFPLEMALTDLPWVKPELIALPMLYFEYYFLPIKINY